MKTREKPYSAIDGAPWMLVMIPVVIITSAKTESVRLGSLGSRLKSVSFDVAGRRSDGVREKCSTQNTADRDSTTISWPAVLCEHDSGSPPVNVDLMEQCADNDHAHSNPTSKALIGARTCTSP